MAQPPSPTVLILAGQRHGRTDPLAAAHGLEHKCLVRLLGRPLIGYVLDAVDQAFPGAAVIVSINDPRALDDEPEAACLIGEGRLTTVASDRNLLESVYGASETAGFPLLITTGDNVLATGDSLRGLHEYGLSEEADAVALFARKEDILAAHPAGQPRFWKFRDGEFSGCNTFWIKDRAALSVGEIFRGGGQFLKFPKRFIGAFGLLNLIGFRLRLLGVARFLDRVSRRFGKRVMVQIARDGRLAIDVDTEFSHRVAERLLQARAAADGTG